MKITISSKLYVEGMPPPLADRVYLELTAPNPEYTKRERMNKWLGGTDQRLSPGARLPEWLPYKRKKAA
jgi:hypothetical protein